MTMFHSVAYIFRDLAQTLYAYSTRITPEKRGSGNYLVFSIVIAS